MAHTLQAQVLLHNLLYSRSVRFMVANHEYYVTIRKEILRNREPVSWMLPTTYSAVSPIPEHCSSKQRIPLPRSCWNSTLQGTRCTIRSCSHRHYIYGCYPECHFLINLEPPTLWLLASNPAARPMPQIKGSVASWRASLLRASMPIGTKPGFSVWNHTPLCRNILHPEPIMFGCTPNRIQS